MSSETMHDDQRKRGEEPADGSEVRSSVPFESDSTEEALRESEDRFRTLAETASDAIIIIDEESTILFVNRSAERLFGYTIAEMLGAKLTMLMPEYLRHLHRAGLHTYIQTGQKHISWEAIELPGLHKSGREIPLEISFGEFTRNGKHFFAGFARNITERKQSEEERLRLLALERAARNEAEHLTKIHAEMLQREQAARAEAEAAHREWQNTFDTMADIVMLVDREDRLIRANTAFFDRFRLLPKECIGHPVGALLHKRKGRLADGRKCPLCKLRSQGKRGVIELPAGLVTDYPVVASTDPIVDADGRTIGVVQVVRDQTELYRARQEAERQRMSLDAIIEQMAEGLLVWDETATVVRANQQAPLIFGFTFEQMHGDRDFLLPEGRFVDEHDQIVAVSELPVQTALRELRVVDSRLWYMRPDSKRVFLSLTASPFFDERNQLAGAVLLVRDVTERRREGERAQQADKLRALGQLASGVAHNFNNALAAVIGYTQLALPKVKEPDAEKYLHVVEQSARDAARMVERIQNFSRESYRRNDFVLVRLSDIVRDAVDITRPRWRNDAEALGIKYQVKLEWQTDEDLMVNGEASELREVFVNIILNALDAMVTGGTVTIFASADDLNVSVSFADTGVGMTEEIERRIFDPFFTTKGVSGLGMGLSESYRIIERHSGRIEVDSRFRRGSTFTIILPCIHPAKNGVRREAMGSPLAKARVLVIDDEDPVRGALAAILSEQGHQVSAVASAEEAFRLLESQDFDVVFTDLAMPRTDGITAAAEIKSRKPATKIVLMSGYGTDKVHERAGDNSGIDASISKPFRMGEIYETMRALTSRQ